VRYRSLRLGRGSFRGIRTPRPGGHSEHVFGAHLALFEAASELENMSTRIYVGNLAFHSTAEVVRNAFAQHGEVTDVHLVVDRQTGQSRGFAFVTMSTEQEAANAIGAMNGAELDGRRLRVNEAEERPARRPFGGGGRGGGRPRG
jgi:RNA recognition motif-containing protein